MVDSGQADLTVAVNIATPGTNQGLIVRGVDANNLYDVGPTGIGLQLNGSYTTLTTYSAPLAAGDTLSVRTSGPIITAYKNGVQVGQVNNAALQTATKVGLWTSSTAARFDDFTAAK